MKAMAPLVGKLARIAGGAAIQAIKTRRTRRIRAGKRVAGGRVRRRLLDLGVSLPIPEGAGPGIQMGTEFAPRAVATKAVLTNLQSFNIRKTETGFPLISNTAAEFTSVPYNETGNLRIYPLNPRLNDVFPGLAAMAGQAAYYRWNSITVAYTPQCGADTQGCVGVAFCPDYSTAKAVFNWATFSGLAKNQKQAAWGASCQLATTECFNTQFLTQGYKCVDPTAADYYDSASNQGFLLIGVTGCANNTTTLGEITIGYNVTLLKPIVDPTTSAGSDHFYYAGAADPDAILAAMDAPGYDTGDEHFEHPPWLHEASGAGHCTVSSGVQGDYTMDISIGGAAFPTLAIAGASGCVVTLLVSEQSTDGTLHSYHWHVKPTTQTHSFEIQQTNDASSVVMLFHRIKHSIGVRLTDWFDT